VRSGSYRRDVAFVRAERMRLVAELVERFENAISSRELQVVTLEAPAGLGKSRVVSELCGQLPLLQPRRPTGRRALVPVSPFQRHVARTSSRRSPSDFRNDDLGAAQIGRNES
jgi:hypothetical protein